MRRVLGLLCALFVLVPAGPAGAREDGEPAVRRLLVFSLPHVTWEMLDAAHAPNLKAVLRDSSVADLAVRVTKRRTEPATGYATIGSGARTVGTGVTGLALGRDEEYEGDLALEVYRRRMGESSSAEVLMLALPDLVGRNARELFGAEVGALGDALSEAGVHRAVIGNADQVGPGGDGDAAADFRRDLAAALMDSEGRVPGGWVDRALLRPDPDAPFGLRLDGRLVERAFVEEWRDRSVVLVEASDLVRAEAYRPFVRSRLRDALTLHWIEESDRLFGTLMRSVDLERDGVLVVGPASPQGDAQLTVAGLRTPEHGPSLLRSSTTRRDGFVTLADVGAGVTELFGVERPDSMEGRPLETGRQGGDFADRVEFLVDENSEARFRDDMVGVMAALYVALNLALSFAAALALRFVAPRGVRLALAAMALVVLAILPLNYLAGAVQFSDFAGAAQYAVYFGVLFGGAGVVAAAAWALGRRDPVTAVGWVLFVVVGVIVGTTVLSNSELLFNTAFGDSPIVAGRFTGINNLTFAQLAAGGIALAVLFAHRLAGRRGVWAAAALLAFLLLVDGLPTWGADVGGVLTAVPAFGYVGYRLWGSPLRPRTLIVLGLATLAVIAAFGLYDLAQPAEDRSHLGRLFEQVESQGGGAFVTVVLRKAAANLRVITSSVWLLMVPGALGFAAYLLWRRGPVVRTIEARVPTFGVALGGLLVAGVLGFALNDSGVAVPGMILGVLNPVMVHLSMRLHG